MKRTALNDLIQWSNQPERKPLVLRGARQVGKSYLVRQLATEKKLDLIEVNLEKQKLRELENRESFSMDKVLAEIVLVTKKRFSPNTLLFIDEIQAQPLAIGSLRYFYEEMPDLRVICAGSLLEVLLQKEKFSMPVGRVRYYYLGPMTFFEFLIASDETVLCEQLKQVEINQNIGKSLHQLASDWLKIYYYVGGMPQVVQEYIETRDYSAARRIQDEIIQTYKDDIPKYAAETVQNILDVFSYVPANLGKKVTFSHVSERHSSSVKNSINLLARAGIIYKTLYNTCSGLPLQAGAHPDILKLYFLDLGLYNAMLDTSWHDLMYLAPEDLLTRGNQAEQFVAQHMVFRNPQKEVSPLFYWLREGKKGNAEVDFVTSNGGVIYPIEVKAGQSGSMRSLWQFVLEHKTKKAIRFDMALRNQLIENVVHKIQTKDQTVEVKCQLVCLPLYLAERLTDFL